MTEKTSRGFIIFDDFTDNRGSEIRIQESSAAFTGPRCWIFCSRENEKDSPHLSVIEAKRLIDALNNFIKMAQLGELCERIDSHEQISDLD